MNVERKFEGVRTQQKRYKRTVENETRFCEASYLNLMIDDLGCRTGHHPGNPPFWVVTDGPDSAAFRSKKSVTEVHDRRCLQ